MRWHATALEVKPWVETYQWRVAYFISSFIILISKSLWVSADFVLVFFALEIISSRMKSEMKWPHAPSHSLALRGTYFLTAGTYQKAHFFNTRERLDVLQRGLLSVASEFKWHLEAWAIFPNHYHFVAHSPKLESNALSLTVMLGKLHGKTANWLNKRDNISGRTIWHNYRETRLTIEGSYLARLNYVHQNAVKHGLVEVGNQYPWCSAGWFERTASPAQVNTIYGLKTDTLNVADDFTVAGVF